MASKTLWKSLARVCSSKPTVFRSPAPSFKTVEQPARGVASHVTRYRGAMVALQSLQPFHSVVADSLFVSKLSCGSQDSSSFIQDKHEGT